MHFKEQNIKKLCLERRINFHVCFITRNTTLLRKTKKKASTKKVKSAESQPAGQSTLVREPQRLKHQNGSKFVSCSPSYNTRAVINVFQNGQ